MEGIACAKKGMGPPQTWCPKLHAREGSSGTAAHNAFTSLPHTMQCMITHETVHRYNDARPSARPAVGGGRFTSNHPLPPGPLEADLAANMVWVQREH